MENGEPGFTCVEAGTSGRFCDLITAVGRSRTGNFAISITGAGSIVNLREPGIVFLLVAGDALNRAVCAGTVSNHDKFDEG